MEKSTWSGGGGGGGGAKRTTAVLWLERGTTAVHRGVMVVVMFAPGRFASHLRMVFFTNLSTASSRSTDAITCRKPGRRSTKIRSRFSSRRKMGWPTRDHLVPCHRKKQMLVLPRAGRRRPGRPWPKKKGVELATSRTCSNPREKRGAIQAKTKRWWQWCRVGGEQTNGVRSRPGTSY